MSMPISKWNRENARRLLEAGLSLIPVSAMTKRPIEKLLPQDPDSGSGSWKPYQQRLAPQRDLVLWLSEGAEFAVVCGLISGSLRVIDFDILRFYLTWQLAVGSLADGLVIQRTGGGGYQAFFRCPNPGTNEKLAWTPDDTKPDGRAIAIETRGEGGYAVIAPSLHPSGAYYELIQGDFAAIPMLSQAHADALSDAARRLCEAPYTRRQLEAMQVAMSRTSQHAQGLNGQVGAIDAWNKATSIEDALRQAGYTHRVGSRWSRPGGTNLSVEVRNNKSYHHSSNDPLNDGRWHDAFDLYSYYEHAGNASSAARAAATILCLPSLTAPAATPAPGARSTASSNPTPAPAAPAQPSPTALQILTSANLTHVGNAECMVALYGDQLRYCHTRKEWLFWDRQRWKEDKDDLTFRLTTEMTKARYLAAANVGGRHRQDLANWAIRGESVTVINATMHAAGRQVKFKSTIDQYDQDPFLASTPTGTLDLQACQIRPPNQDDYISLQLGTHFDDSATCPRWIRFLDEVFPGDPDLIAYIQRAFGYSLTGSTDEQKMFLCHGEGANGKSKLFTVLFKLLGEYAGSTSFATFDAEQVNPTGEDVASLRGKRIVTLIETEQDKRLNETKAKQLTGQDPVTCRHLYGHRFTYWPTYKIWLAMNHLPVVRGTDHGIWRKVVLIPFSQRFDPRQEPDLEATLLSELPGILNWALEGLRAWRQQGLGSCAAIDRASGEYRAESDIIAQWLIEETIDDPAGVLPATDAYQLFHLWSKNRGERWPMTQNAWSRYMTKRKYQDKRIKVDSKLTTCYLGIRLRSDWDPDPSAQAPASTAQAPAATPAAPPSDHDRDKRIAQEARALARAGKFDKARLKASEIRARKTELALEQWIDKVERGELAPDESS